jgi:hypothetical protein
LISGGPATAEIEVEGSKPNGYAMVFIPMPKPSERPAYPKNGDADAPDRKRSHYCDWQIIGTCQTERLQHIPERPPKEKIQDAHEQKYGE